MSSPSLYFAAFLFGGILCLVGQILIDKTKLTPARILVLYVVIGVILGAVGVYQPLIDHCGAGATVPLTGFGANLASGIHQKRRLFRCSDRRDHSRRRRNYRGNVFWLFGRSVFPPKAKGLRSYHQG